MEFRFSCKTNVVPTMCQNNRAQPCKSYVGLTRNSGGDSVNLYIITSKSPDTKKTYSLTKRNIEAVHCRMLKDGKMSITFKSPPHLVMFSDAKLSELNILIRTLKDPTYFLQLDLDSIKTVVHKSKAPKADVKSMTIESMSQYPPLTGVGFPKTLTDLTISGLNYRHLENRICALESLKSLNLSNNRLTKLPLGLFEMKSLISLDVEHNQISVLPSLLPADCNLCKNITNLNISNNRLGSFPEFVRHCKSLNTLKIAGNPINFIPNYLKSCSSTLRVLDVERCQLRNLPACLTQFSLNKLMLDGNPFPPPINVHTGQKAIYKERCGKSWSAVPSLQACCVKSIVRHGLTVSPYDLPRHLLNYIDSIQYCDGCCRLVMENSIVYYQSVVLRKFAHSFTHFVCPPVITGFVCSFNCFKRVQLGKKVLPASLYFNQRQ